MTEKSVLSEVLMQLTEKSGKEVVLKNSNRVGGGCIHHATRIDTNIGSFFLKWNDACAPDMFIREAECLSEMKKAQPHPLVIPEIILAREAGTAPGFLLLEYLEEGIPSQGEENLGRGLAILHQYRGKKFGFHNNNYCGLTSQDNSWQESWPKFFAEQRIGSLVRKIHDSGGFTSEERRLFDRLTDKIPSILPFDIQPALIHGDLWSGNYMLTRKGPALIDPASYYADREMELGIMTLFGGFSGRFMDAYNEAYPLLPDWRSRNRLYQLYHILNHYLLFGGSYGSSAVQTARYYV
jgi:protein-ribulosamine 3-kinase